MHSMKTPLALLATVGVVGAAALAPSVVTADPIAQTAATKDVSAKDNFFSPSSVRVRRGSTIKVTWRGQQSHNVVGPGASSGFKKRGTYSFRARKSATYRCTIHPGMNLKVGLR